MSGVTGGGASGPVWDERCLRIKFIGGGETSIRFVNRATAAGALKRMVEASPDQRVMFDWDITADESCHLIYPSKVAEVILPPLNQKRP